MEKKLTKTEPRFDDVLKRMLSTAPRKHSDSVATVKKKKSPVVDRAKPKS